MAAVFLPIAKQSNSMKNKIKAPTDAMYPQRRFKNCLPSWVLNCAPDVNVSVQHVVTNPFPSMSMVGQSTSPLMRKEAKHDVLCLPSADLFPQEPGMEKVIDYVEKYKDVLIKDELSLDALKHEIGDVVNRINAEHPKMKRMQYTASLIDNDRTIRIEAHVISGGCPDTVFFLDICKVRSIYQFSEKANMLEQKGGENG